MATVDTFSSTPIPVSGFEGSAFALSLANIVTNDTNITNFWSTLIGAMGTQSTGTIVPGEGGFLLQGSHTYAEEGHFIITAQLTGSGDTATVASSALITDAPLTAQSETGLTPTQGVPFTGILATFQDTDPGGTLTDYTATIIRPMALRQRQDQLLQAQAALRSRARILIVQQALK